MAFTFKRVDFINDREYSQVNHAQALFNGLPSFSTEGFELQNNNTELTNGTAIVKGIPIRFGNSGEIEIITPSANRYIVLEIVLNDNIPENATINLLQTNIIPPDTNLNKYFALYQFDENGEIDIELGKGFDFRHNEYIKNLDLIFTSPGVFKFIVNGKESNSVVVPEYKDAVFYELSSIGLTDNDIPPNDQIGAIRVLIEALQILGSSGMLFLSVDDNFPNLQSNVVGDEGIIVLNYVSDLKSELSFFERSGVLTNAFYDYTNDFFSSTDITNNLIFSFSSLGVLNSDLTGTNADEDFTFIIDKMYDNTKFVASKTELTNFNLLMSQLIDSVVVNGNIEINKINNENVTLKFNAKSQIEGNDNRIFTASFDNSRNPKLSIFSELAKQTAVENLQINQTRTQIGFFENLPTGSTTRQLTESIQNFDFIEIVFNTSATGTTIASMSLMSINTAVTLQDYSYIDGGGNALKRGAVRILNNTTLTLGSIVSSGGTSPAFQKVIVYGIKLNANLT